MEGIEKTHNQESCEEFSDKLLTVYRVRHGETNYKEHTSLDGTDVDWDLTETGRDTIQRSAEAIANELDPERDIVLLATSVRKRTQNSLDIIRQELAEQGFDVRYDDDRSIRDWLQGTDILDDAGDPIPLGTPEHAEEYADLAAMPDLNERRERGELTNIESPEAVNDRARKHMALLTRFANQLKFPEGKRMVVVEAEHEETLDELLSRASHGARSMANGNSSVRGEVLKLGIPREREAEERTVEVSVESLTGDEISPAPATVQFNYLDRRFEDSRNGQMVDDSSE